MSAGYRSGNMPGEVLFQWFSCCVNQRTQQVIIKKNTTLIKIIHTYEVFVKYNIPKNINLANLEWKSNFLI